MVHLGSLGSHPLKTMDGFEIHGTDLGRPLITDAPALTFQELFHRRFRELAPGHQGPFALGELTAAEGAAQPFDVLVFTRPRAMANVAGVGPMELLTIWIGARKC